jgi:cellulose synthase/poly-beta-1,6-N-acetylglucosamine synthase-like glycosyltransferase
MGAGHFVPVLFEFSFPSSDSLLFLTLLILTNIVPFGEALDASARLHLRKLHLAGSKLKPGRTSMVLAPDVDGGADQVLRPYAIVASVHNVEGQLGGFLESFHRHRERIWMIDDSSDDRTVAYLAREGVKTFRIPRNSKKPAALRVLVHALPPEIATVLVVDPDVTLGADVDLEKVIARFQRSGCGAACPRIAVAEEGVLSYFQALEYELAMLLGRASLRDFSVTSGVALYRRDALQRALDLHSLSVYAEDLENTFLLLSQGERIYYEGELLLRASCPSTWSHWFSQRVGWSYGLLRVYALHWRRLWAVRRGPVFVYQYFVYLGLLSIAMQPVRFVTALLVFASAANALDAVLGLGLVADVPWTSPYYFLLGYAQHTTLILALSLFVCDSEGRARHVLVVPIYFVYVLLQAFPVTLGFLNWISLRAVGRRLYRDHYTDSPHPAVLGSAALETRA